MKQAFIFEKTSTCYSDINIGYLDETSTEKLSQKRYPERLSLKQKGEKISMILSSVDYLTKEYTGRVSAGGFLRDKLLKPGKAAPETWKNETRKKKISEEIEKHISEKGRYRGAVGHKLVISMDTHLQKKIEKAGLNPDRILVRTVKKVLQNFQNKFHPGDRIGYAYGVHHDTNNLHLHVFLCNRTEKGAHVAMSRPLKGFHDSRPRKSQIEYCQQRLVLQEKWISTMITNEKKLKISLFPSHILSQSVNNKRLKPPEFSALHVFELQALQQQYNTLIRLQMELQRAYKPKKRKSNRGLRLLGIGKDLRNFNLQNRIKSFRQRQEKARLFFALKRDYLNSLQQFKRKSTHGIGHAQVYRQQLGQRKGIVRKIH